jgi:hypothetical protein
MTVVERLTGAAPNLSISAKVKRLQMRIAKAEHESEAVT